MQPIIRKSAKEARARYDAACLKAIELYVPGRSSREWREATYAATKLYDAWLNTRYADRRIVKRAA